MGGIRVKKSKNKSDRAMPQGKGVRLPNLNNRSAYLQHPGEGLAGKAKYKPGLKQVMNQYPVKMCGLCGAKHAPGEPHRAQKAAHFNQRTGRTGIARVGGGYVAPRDSS